MKFSEFKYERINMEEVTGQMEELLAELKQQTAAEDFYRVFLKTQEVEKKIGRNDPCPCGSGKKYKNCHGRLNNNA